MAQAPQLSIVVPIYNEEQTLPLLIERTTKVLDGTVREGTVRSHELILVDDGSDDRSLELMRDAARERPEIRVVRLSRNFGLQSAVTAGLSHARGEIIGLMDGDLQDPPELLPEMLGKLEQGHDVVYMLKRRRRREPLLRRLGFWLFYWLFARLSQTPLPPTAGLFSLMRRRVVRAILDCPERNRFVPGLRSWVGFSQAGLEFDRDARHAGDPRQSFRRLLRLALDGLYSFTDLPLKLALVLGLGTASLGLAAILVVSSLRIFTDLAIPGWASTLVAIFFMGGVQLICVGVLGEYIARIYDEVRRRPQFIVAEVIDSTADEATAEEAAPATPPPEESSPGPPPA